MNWQRMVFVVLLGVLIGAFAVLQYSRQERISIVYKTVRLDRGEIVAYVSATGTVNPLTTVEVGSQAGGILKEIHADFNSRVKKGDALARLDPTIFEAQIRQAEATVRKATEDVQLAKKILDENAELVQRRLIAQEEYDDSRTKYSASLATLEQAKATLEIARSTLHNATIRSPIHGMVISRHVNPGQTITAGAQALFVIAGDLVKMQLETNVSEADIGKIKNSQEAFFTVDAYPGETFKGKVTQIRNAPIITQNVVTYNVVLAIDNKDLKLKPGMTADVKILVAQKQDVLRVPREALRFLPPPGAHLEDSGQSGAAVWTLQADGLLRAVPMTSGISDENYTEVVGGELREGTEVIVEAMEKSTSGSELLGPSVLPQPKRF